MSLKFPLAGLVWETTGGVRCEPARVHRQPPLLAQGGLKWEKETVGKVCGLLGCQVSLFLGKESSLHSLQLFFRVPWVFLSCYCLFSRESPGLWGSELALELETRSLEGPSSVGTAMQRHCLSSACSGSLLTGTKPHVLAHVHLWVQPLLCAPHFLLCALLPRGWAGLSGTR